MINLPGYAFVCIDGVLDYSDYGFMTYFTIKALSNCDKCKGVCVKPRTDVNMFASDDDVDKAVKYTGEEFNIYISINSQEQAAFYTKDDEHEFVQMYVTDKPVITQFIENNIDVIVCKSPSTLSKIYTGVKYKLPAMFIDNEIEQPDDSIFLDIRTRVLVCTSNKFWQQTVDMLYDYYTDKSPVTICILDDANTNPNIVAYKRGPQIVVRSTHSVKQLDRFLNSIDIAINTSPTDTNNVIYNSCSAKAKTIISTHSIKQLNQNAIIDVVDSYKFPGWTIGLKSDCKAVDKNDLYKLLSIAPKKAPDHYPEITDSITEFYNIYNNILNKIFTE